MLTQLQKCLGRTPSPAEIRMFNTDDGFRNAMMAAMPKSVKLAGVFNGIGDAVSCLYAVAGAKAKWPDKEIHYYVRSHLLQWVKLFDGYDFLHPLPPGAKDLINLNAGYNAALGKIPCWKRYCLNADPPRGVDPVRPNLLEREKIIQEGAAYAGCVALCIKAAYGSRNWTHEKWLELEKLLMARGYKTVIVHNDMSQMMGFHGEKLWGRKPREIVSILLNASRVIGIESGMASLSSVLGLKPIVLCGPSIASQWYREAVDVIGTGGVDGQSCAGCFWQRPYTTKCDAGCAALQSITPEMVMAKI
jgi:ADP-heptose:LPS heptosyltransferase